MTLLAFAGSAAARPGDEVRPRNLHLGLAAIATRGYLVDVETVGHHRVVLSVRKGGEFASYTVRGKVNRHRIKADFGRFGRVSLHFHGRPHRLESEPGSAKKSPRKQVRCRGRRPELEVGHFRGTLEFQGHRDFTKLALGKAPGEVRRSYRRVCRPSRKRAQAGISSSTTPNPFGFTLNVLVARSRVGRTLTRFSAISIESPLGIRLPGNDLFSVASAEVRERVGRVRVLRSLLQVTKPDAIQVSRRGVRPATARVTLDSPFGGSARYEGPTKGSAASWTGSLSARLLGSGRLPLTGPRFRTTLCRANAFSPSNPCFRQAEASILVQGSGSHSHPFAEARLSSFR